MTTHGFTNTPAERWFEDYRVGLTFEFGSALASEEEIIAFAKKFDPQTMHVDPEAAKHGHFGGLIASGWHTMALVMRLFVDHYVSSVAGVASPGIDELRWPRPVRPGDVLRVRGTILEARISASKPDRGFVRTHAEGVNQNDEVVASMKAMNLFLVRPT